MVLSLLSPEVILAVDAEGTTGAAEGIFEVIAADVDAALAAAAAVMM